MIVRPETAADVAAIRNVTQTAFDGASHSDGTEVAIIDALRQCGALTLSLVAEKDGDVVGHVALSPVRISGGETDWFGLGPISVLPAQQGQGIGSALVNAAIAGLADLGAGGCVLLGDPAYYHRFGFRAHGTLVFPGPPREYFMALTLHGKPASGIVQYNEAFYGAAA